MSECTCDILALWRGDGHTCGYVGARETVDNPVETLKREKPEWLKKGSTVRILPWAAARESAKALNDKKVAHHIRHESEIYGISKPNWDAYALPNHRYIVTDFGTFSVRLSGIPFTWPYWALLSA